MDNAWVMNAIEQIALFGKGESGTTRLAFTPDDMAAREYVKQLMNEAGLSVRTDEIGNIIGRIEADNADGRLLPAVATGSHIDTVPDGGMYDGVVGVIGAIAAAKRVQTRGPLAHPLEVIVFAAEESSRFGVASIGSKMMAGIANSKTWAKVKDKKGTLLSTALAEWGLSLQQADVALREKKDIKAFVELHIEQGRILEKESKHIGIVEKVAAPTRCKITVEGEAAHSGTTPMDERQDALVTAAMIVLAVQEIATEQAHNGVVATVGAMKVYPGAINVVPGLVEMWVDIRGVEHESIIDTLQEMKDAVSTIADAQETSVSIEILSSEKPALMHEEIKHLIEKACQKKSLSYQYLHSGAGHDAVSMSYLAPSGLIFIPCKNGVSHHGAEYAAPDDIFRGVDVLAEVLYQLAGQSDYAG